MIRAAVSSIDSSVISITGQPRAAVDLGGVVELLVDLDESGILAVAAAQAASALLADLGEPLRADRQADHLRLLDLEQRARRVDALDHGHVRGERHVLRAAPARVLARDAGGRAQVRDRAGAGADEQIRVAAMRP